MKHWTWLKKLFVAVAVAVCLSTGTPSISWANICDDAADANWHHPGLNSNCIMLILMQIDHYGSCVDYC